MNKFKAYGISVLQALPEAILATTKILVSIIVVGYALDGMAVAVRTRREMLSSNN